MHDAIDLSDPARDLCVFLVAGEHSGDALGAKLMAAIAQASSGRVRFVGVGGPLMEAQGMASLFPLTDVAIIGLAAIVRRLPHLLRRFAETVRSAVACQPDVVVIIDSPEFTHPIARRLRRRRPDIPIIDYVSPSVWAWRSGRAARMRGYVDHVLALLPFEPAAHARLGGPPCSYVGHPLIERLKWIEEVDPAPLAQRLGLSASVPIIVVLPGSRRSEVERLIAAFGRTIDGLVHAGVTPQIIIPTVGHVADLIRERVRSWPVAPHIVCGDLDKWRAFKLARVALAASGTVTLELALARTPMVVAYKIEPLMAPFLRRMISATTIILPNLILQRNVFPEFVQEACTPERLSAALLQVMQEGPERDAQIAALTEIPVHMLTAGDTPSLAAADIVLRYAHAGRGHGRRTGAH